MSKILISKDGRRKNWLRLPYGASKPRDVVGMTEGAKKRCIRFWIAGLDADTYSTAIGDTQAFYRRGQRLRPCPGCHGCRPGEKGWHIDKVRGRFTPSAVAWCCDGSGVIPAKARKVLR